MHIESKSESKPEKSCKFKHIYYAIAGWAVFFILFFSIKSIIKPRYYIHCKLDDAIPFVKWFVFPYCLWYVYLFAVLLYFALVSKDDFIKLQLNIFSGMAFCILIYLVYPNAINFRPVITGTGPVLQILKMLFTIDSSTMVTPSMHVFAAASVHISLVKSKKTRGSRPLIALSFILMAFICASTVFIKQHSVIDVFWGLVLAAALYFPFYGKRFAKRLTLNAKH